MVATTESEVMLLAKRMSEQERYEDAWTIGLEIQAFGKESIEAFEYVLRQGTLAARRATAFWLSDEAEAVPPQLFLSIAQDPDDDIRYYAAYGLGYMVHPAVVAQLQRLMLQDSSIEVRQTAVPSLFSAAKLNRSLEKILRRLFNKNPLILSAKKLSPPLATFWELPLSMMQSTCSKRRCMILISKLWIRQLSRFRC
jgi:hypothetical protein